jgi:hypothetical protein
MQDPKISCLIQKLQDNSLVSLGYSWHNDELLYKGCLYLSKQLQIKYTVLSELHAKTTTRSQGLPKPMTVSNILFFLGWYETRRSQFCGGM